ncbi:hypothetical protein Gohar_008664 [Gossypium harknessii]|uniref:Uncharacterized protein n=1 Tax=Gossypium harknessii TaxID=34285 RepID=A0A7J9GKD5_9ROSI|nr:hypothetical protein [Gossypium harknessii]
MSVLQYSEENIAIYRAVSSLGSSLKSGYRDTQKGYMIPLKGVSILQYCWSVKKVRIPELEGDSDVAMDTISPIDKNLSWKDYLLRNGPMAGERTDTINNVEGEEDFEQLESDIVRSSINGIPSIHFSEWVNQLLIKDMARTVVIKLLGRNIGYSVLYNTMCSL